MAGITIILVVVYVVIGLAFGLCFIFKGIGTVDPAAKGGPLVFRLLILPGMVGLWPMMLKKWLSARTGQDQ